VNPEYFVVVGFPFSWRVREPGHWKILEWIFAYSKQFYTLDVLVKQSISGTESFRGNAAIKHSSDDGLLVYIFKKKIAPAK
jgi:hypothetical protein